MADETQQATTNSALPFGSRAKQGISQFHGVRSYLCAHVSVQSDAGKHATVKYVQPDRRS